MDSITCISKFEIQIYKIIGNSSMIDGATQLIAMTGSIVSCPLKCNSIEMMLSLPYIELNPPVDSPLVKMSAS